MPDGTVLIAEPANESTAGIITTTTPLNAACADLVYSLSPD